jgi:hypothetical protein
MYNVILRAHETTVAMEKQLVLRTRARVCRCGVQVPAYA